MEFYMNLRALLDFFSASARNKNKLLHMESYEMAIRRSFSVCDRKRKLIVKR